MTMQELRREKREQWAKLFDKECLWCGVKSHNGDFCNHPYFQTWDKDNPDSKHFYEWLETTNYEELADAIQKDFH